MCGRLTTCVANDRVLGSLDHGGLVNVGETTVDEVELVQLEQRRHDGLDLYVGKGLADAAVAARTKWHIAELLIASYAGHVQEPVQTNISYNNQTMQQHPV